MNKNLVTALLLGIEGVLFFAFIMPQYHTLSGARQSFRDREVLLQDTQTAQRNIVSLGEQYAKNESTIALVLLALPKQKQYDYLTEIFQSAAQSSGVQLSSLTIGTTEKGKEDYKAIPLKTEIKSSYIQLLSFLDTLEHSLRLYDISKVDITGAGFDGGSNNNLTIVIQGDAYSLK